MKTKKINLEIEKTNAEILEILAKRSNFEDVKSLLEYIAYSIVDGARRPSAWERGMIESLGIQAENDYYCSSDKELLNNYKESEKIQGEEI